MQLFGEGASAEMQDELEKILKYDLPRLDWKKPPKHSLYGWYYATQCMFQKGGKHWKAWNNKFQTVLKKHQHPEGYWEWPEHPHGPIKGLTGKIYATTLCALMLTVYYRHLPMTSKGKGGKKVAKKPTKQEREAAAGEEEIDIF